MAVFYLARGASQREFRGCHETRNTAFEARGSESQARIPGFSLTTDH